MDYKTKNENFKRRFNIEDEQSDSIIEFQEFKQRILNIFGEIDLHIGEREIIEFCNRFGKKVNKERGDIRSARNIYNILKEETDEIKFYFLIEMLFTLPIVLYYDDRRIDRETLYKLTKEAFSISKIRASISMLASKEVIVFPRGEEILDKELVEKVFKFLDSTSRKHFIAALRFYDDVGNEARIKSVESIRRAIEEFLRFKLNNIKGLEANIQEIGNRFKESKVSNEIRNIARKTLDYLDKYFNGNSKHNDGKIEEAENEFIIYQAGLLMRYINKKI